MRCGPTAASDLSPRARRSPSTSTATGGSSSRATPSRCLGLMSLLWAGAWPGLAPAAGKRPELELGRAGRVAEDYDPVVADLDEAAAHLEP